MRSARFSEAVQNYASSMKWARSSAVQRTVNLGLATSSELCRPTLFSLPRSPRVGSVSQSSRSRFRQFPSLARSCSWHAVPPSRHADGRSDGVTASLIHAGASGGDGARRAGGFGVQPGRDGAGVEGGRAGGRGSPFSSSFQQLVRPCRLFAVQRRPAWTAIIGRAVVT